MPYDTSQRLANRHDYCPQVFFAFVWSYIKGMHYYYYHRIIISNIITVIRWSQLKCLKHPRTLLLVDKNTYNKKREK